MARLPSRMQIEKPAAPLGAMAHVRGQGSRVAGDEVRHARVTISREGAGFCEGRHGMGSVGWQDGQVLQGSALPLPDYENHPTDKPLLFLSDDAAVRVGQGLQST